MLIETSEESLQKSLPIMNIFLRYANRSVSCCLPFAARTSPLKEFSGFVQPACIPTKMDRSISSKKVRKVDKRYKRLSDSFFFWGEGVRKSLQKHHPKLIIRSQNNKNSFRMFVLQKKGIKSISKKKNNLSDPRSETVL